MKTAMQGTSLDAWRQLPLSRLKTQGDRIADVVASSTQSDMSLREIARDFEIEHGLAIDISTVSARVNALIAAQRLQRLETTRPCRVSGKTVHPVRIPKNNKE